MVKRNFEYIDALRGLAILMVVLVHTSQYVDGLSIAAASVSAFSQLGVQLFFVASALTMCLSYAPSVTMPSINRNLAFACKRFFRIAPLYYLAIPLYAALWAIKSKFQTGELHIPADYSFAAISSNLLFIHDFVPFAQNNIVPGGWSIGVEMAFYVLFPILFMRFRKHGFALKPLLAAIAVSVVANLVLNISIARFFGTSIANQSFAYYFLLNQIPVFLIGFLVYGIIDRRASHHTHNITTLSALAFVGFLVATFAVWRADWYISFLLVPSFAGGAFGALTVLASHFNNYPKLLRKIGVLSYAIYILHFICTKAIEPVLIQKFGARIPLTADLQLLLFFVLNVSLAVAMALIAHWLVEKPAIKLGRNLADALVSSRTVAKSA